MPSLPISSPPHLLIRSRTKGQPPRAAIRVNHERVYKDSPCWEWQGSNNGRQGYGQIWDRSLGRMQTAHVAMYERFVGSIPDGLQLDHLCRNRICCNPAHLEPVTQLENSRRGSNVKLEEKDVETIRALRKEGIPHKEIATRFGISRFYSCAVSRGTGNVPKFVTAAARSPARKGGSAVER